MTTNDALVQLLRDLGGTCGFELALVEGSITIEGDYITATARSRSRVPPERRVRLEMLAKLMISPNDAGGTETWALLFFFVNGERVTPRRKSHLTLKLSRGSDGVSRWMPAAWEADVNEEWTGLEQLDDEGQQLIGLSRMADDMTYPGGAPSSEMEPQGRRGHEAD